MKISLEEFDTKKFKKDFAYEEDNRKAIVTHYLHNYHNGIKDHFKDEAVIYLKQIVEYKNHEEKLNLLSDVAEQLFLFEVENAPFPTPKDYNFKFIDLFAGIGGFRLALQNLGGRCVFTSEWNENAKKTYNANFGETPFGDITKEYTKNYIPKDFDVLCAGFPCQAFSIAGYRKGFHDTRGTLFFDIEKIIEKHRPKVVFLENVKNLVSHDNGNTFKIIIEILEEKLGYKVYSKILNSSTHANVPQNRERIFIVAFDPKQVKNYSKFRFPEPIPLTKTIHDFLEKGKQNDSLYYKKEHPYYPELKKTITSKNTIYQWRRVYVRENKNNMCPTLTANMGAGGHNVPLILDDFGIRKLTPKECFAFQGYPVDKFVLPNISNSGLYMQAGNSVTTTLIERIFIEILKVM
ncbi:DNA (cytosine-5-)-methyltransferase [Flavobacterium sp.]|uniref:DNA (cytosine-5-)-methyltransferase n=1 Tax=Flavobacterium sp. TaxID=239 RepID=UPI002FDAA7A1